MVIRKKVADIYVNRQELVMQLTKKFIKNKYLDTSDQNFVRVTRQIIDELKLKPNLN